MLRYILKRVILAFISLLILISIVYLLVVSFGDRPAALINENLKPEEIENNIKLYGLDKPAIVRLGYYLKDFFQFNYGEIYGNNNGYPDIPSYFFQPLKWTILITLPSFIISAIFGIFLGIVAGYNRGKFIDHLINLFVIVFIGLPSFVIAPIILLVANTSNGLIISEFARPDLYGWFITFKSLVLPIFTVTLGSLAGYTILVRNQIVTVLTSNHILIAKAKGLNQWEIFWKHVLRNISIPLISYLLPSFIFLLAGNIIIEQFFNVPGTSVAIVNAFPNGEVNVVMFSIFFYSAISMIAQLILDISYIFIDPKIKYFEDSKISLYSNFKHWCRRKRNGNRKMINNVKNVAEERGL